MLGDSILPQNDRTRNRQERNDRIELISRLAAILVGTLALMAFILSYNSLQHMAATNGITGNLSYVWPLLLDFAMIVFSLAILRANLRQEPAWYPWLLTVTFAAMATIANVLDVTTLGIPAVAIGAFVKALAPVALVVAFELLMGMMRAELRRANVVKSTADLLSQQAGARQELADVTAHLDTLKKRIQDRQSELDRLMRTNADAGADGPAFVTGDLTALDKANEARQDKVTERRAAVLSLLNEGLSPDAISERLEVSLRTIRRDIMSLNGQVRVTQ